MPKSIEFPLNDPDISDNVRREYDMQMVPIKEYAEKISREYEIVDMREEIALKLLARGMSLQEAAEITELPIEDLQDLIDDLKQD
jgi:predicted HTH domain antitoxin